MSQNCGLYII